MPANKSIKVNFDLLVAMSGRRAPELRIISIREHPGSGEGLPGGYKARDNALTMHVKNLTCSSPATPSSAKGNCPLVLQLARDRLVSLAGSHKPAPDHLASRNA